MEVIGGKNLVTLNGSTVGDEYIFQNAAIAAGTGNKLALNGADKAVVSINRSSITANEITFLATGPNGVACYILGYKIESSGAITSAASSTILTNEVWNFEGLKGYTNIYFPINSMSGTSITIKGLKVA